MSSVEPKHFLLVLLLAFLGLAALTLSKLFAPLILGILLSGLAYPLYKEILTRLSKKENLAALLAMLVVSLVIVLPFTGVLTLLLKEAFGLFDITRGELVLHPSVITMLGAISEKLHINLVQILTSELGPVFKNLGLTISKEIGSVLGNAIRLVLNFFIMLVTVFYMLRDGKALGEFLIRFSPLKTSEELNLYTIFKDTARAIFYGSFISAIAQGILGGIGFSLFGLGSPVLWGSVMAFLALIPFLGPYLIFLPAAFYLYATGSTPIAIGFLIYNLAIVSSIDNLIKPKLISSRIKIHPLLIMLSIFGGFQMFGLLGIIYGPLIFAIFLALVNLYTAPHEV